MALIWPTAICGCDEFVCGGWYINRVWSASTDGYVDKVNKYIDKTTTQFDDAHALFVNLLESTKQA